MSYKGSLSYLKFSPYQISSYSKQPMAFTSHWFLIRLLTSIINLTTYGNSLNIRFSSENMVANGWFKMYLNQEQFIFLKNSNNFEFYPIENIHKISLLNSLQNEDCYVYASNDWEPPSGARIISHISDTLFRVTNLTIDESVKKDPRILTIKPVSHKKTNNRYNSGFLQNHHQKSVYDHNIYAPIRSLHNIGLDGTGQIINIVDTGVDVSNAMFYDASNPIETISGKTNQNHRKVIRIEKYADDLDYYSGHGTHVAGIAAGKAYCTDCGISQYNGIASGAKIYFSDVGYSSTSGDLSEEFDLEEQASLLSSLNSFISSNSWSYDSPIKEDVFAYDQVSYKHPDLIYFFAAGNDYSYFSINSPSCGKNVVSVGATNAVSSSAAESSTNQVVVENETYSFNCFERTSGIIRSLGISSKMTYLYNLPVVIYDNSESSDFKNKIVLFNFSSDSSSADVCNAYTDSISKGAKAVIFGSSFSFRCGSNSIPAISANDDAFNIILTMKSLSIFPYSGSEVGLPQAAGLSSKGPSDMALSKPDLAVPGTRVISAKSHGTHPDYIPNSEFGSNLVQMSGTSMATPAAAGVAAIIRQFLCDGFYPSLKKNPKDSIHPSSCLVRAMMFNGAVKPYSSVSSKSGPNHEVGFGIPCLESVFGFKGSGLRLVDNVKMPSQTHHVYQITLDNNLYDFVCTMVYLDPPLNPDNDANFFADLDIFVKAPNGKFFIGNDVSNLADSDSFSVSERIVIDKEEIPENGGVFEIHVTSTEYPIFDEKVTYSIVVNGPFEQEVSQKNPQFLKAKNADESNCYNNCNQQNGNGKCNKNGLCECIEGFTGLSCNTKINTIMEGEYNKAKYSHKQIKYFKLKPKKPSANLTFVDFNLQISNTQANLFFCTSTELNPGQITNAGWNCHLSNQKDYSIELLDDDNQKSLFLAIYTSYYETVDVELSNILFSSKERPTSKPKENYKKALFIAGYVVCGLIGAALVAGLVVLIVKICKRKKQPITDPEINEHIVATVNNYDEKL